MLRAVRRLYLLALVGATACQGGATRGDNDDAGTADGAVDPNGDDRGAVWYGTLCASCHGTLGEGGTGPALNAWSRPKEMLVATIDERMPLGSPDRCKDDCPVRVADYILEHLQVPTPMCTGLEPSVRRLRLLTRREYRQTIADLLAVESVICMGEVDCAVEHQSCSAGVCVEDPCRLHTFVLDVADRAATAVVVAGSFNAWAPTAAQGAWPLERLPGTNRWIGKHALADGEHTYKFVLDGQDWRTDPLNPNTVPDGVGGSNSRLVQSCGGGVASADPTEHFPGESRPAGYFFDGHAASGVVTPVHIDEYFGAAAVFAERAAGNSQLYDCADPACDERFVRSFGARAFRRPLTEEEVSRYLALFGADRRQGLLVLLEVMLTSPSFLYRSELGTADGDRYRLDGYELASALSYQLWGTMPDAPLFAAAAAGRLTTPDGRVAEAERLLSDPRAQVRLGDFAVDWLGLGGLLDQPKRGDLYPEVTPALRQSMLAETRRFFAAVALDPTARYRDLLLADYGFVDAGLAQLYGLSGSFGPTAIRTTLPAERRGILGQASFLFAYAHSDQSSPIKRGVFVRERILCQKFGVPPPEAGGLPDVDPNATTRERFEMHSSKASCRACHQFIDGVGFGFERFDAIGRFRGTENGLPIDARGTIVDLEAFGRGTAADFETLPALAGFLADSQAGPACLATQYHRFAQGETAGETDRCLLEAIVQRFQQSGGDLRGMILDGIKDETYALRRGEP